MFEPAVSSIDIAVSPTLTLVGDVRLPAAPVGWVIFAHASSATRLNPRYRQVAQRLHRANIATLLADLLTPREDEDSAQRTDLALLGERLRTLTLWLQGQEIAARQPIGYFGANAGAAAALNVAAEAESPIRAIVARGGHLDLLDDSVLAQVQAPTLLLVGSHDVEALEPNRQAYRH